MATGAHQKISHGILFLIILLGGFFLSGCGLFYRSVKMPLVSLVDLRLADATLFEQRFAIRLRIQNPNSFAIPIEGMQFVLDLRGQPFAQGVSGAAVEAPAMGSCFLELEAVSTTLALVRQLSRLQLEGAPEVLPYRVHGTLRAMGRDDFPFDYQGNIDLAGVLNRL